MPVGRRGFLAGLLSLPVAAIVPEVFEEIVKAKPLIQEGDYFTIDGVFETSSRLTVPAGVTNVRLFGAVQITDRLQKFVIVKNGVETAPHNKPVQAQAGDYFELRMVPPDE